MGWKMPTLGNSMLAFCHSWDIFTIFHCYFIFVAKKISHEISLELNLGLDDNIKYEIRVQILYHVIPQGQSCHPKTQAWLRLGPLESQKTAKSLEYMIHFVTKINVTSELIN